MDPVEWNDRISQIPTMWTVLRQAHDGSPAEMAVARELIVRRYGPAAHKYLLAVVGDQDVADELLQEFALAIVRGDLHGADPERGRFRTYVKAVLFHLVGRHRKKEQKTARSVPGDDPALADLAAPTPDDREFEESWKGATRPRWKALAAANPSFFTVLRLRADNLRMPAPEMAAELSRRTGKPHTSAGVRQTLRRAREKFTELLLEEVAHSLDDPSRERVEEELADLHLLEYCRDALEGGRRFPS